MNTDAVAVIFVISEASAVIEDDGDIGLDIGSSKARVISISLSSDGTIYYAAHLDDETTHGKGTLIEVYSEIARLVQRHNELEDAEP